MRAAYLHRQRIALIRDEDLPPLSSFFEVRCRDISQGGFSFDSPVYPNEPALVVALGTAPPYNYVVAQIMHVTPAVTEGQKSFIVGCKFTERVAY